MIRPYASSDCAPLLDVWARASALAHPFLSQAFLEAERTNIPKVYLPIADTWVWDEAGRLAGFISLLGNEIGAVFVDPDHHRHGVGRALIQHAQQQRGALEVDVFSENTLGRSFYAALGFELHHRYMHPPTGFEVMHLVRP